MSRSSINLSDLSDIRGEDSQVIQNKQKQGQAIIRLRELNNKLKNKRVIHNNNDINLTSLDILTPQSTSTQSQMLVKIAELVHAQEDPLNSAAAQIALSYFSTVDNYKYIWVTTLELFQIMNADHQKIMKMEEKKRIQYITDQQNIVLQHQQEINNQAAIVANLKSDILIQKNFKDMCLAYNKFIKNPISTNKKNYNDYDTEFSSNVEQIDKLVIESKQLAQIINNTMEENEGDSTLKQRDLKNQIDTKLKSLNDRNNEISPYIQALHYIITDQVPDNIKNWSEQDQNSLLQQLNQQKNEASNKLVGEYKQIRNEGFLVDLPDDISMTSSVNQLKNNILSNNRMQNAINHNELQFNDSISNISANQSQLNETQILAKQKRKEDKQQRVNKQQDDLIKNYQRIIDMQQQMFQQNTQQSALFNNQLLNNSIINQSNNQISNGLNNSFNQQTPIFSGIITQGNDITHKNVDLYDKARYYNTPWEFVIKFFNCTSQEFINAVVDSLKEINIDCIKLKNLNFVSDKGAVSGSTEIGRILKQETIDNQKFFESVKRKIHPIAVSIKVPPFKRQSSLVMNLKNNQPKDQIIQNTMEIDYDQHVPTHEYLLQQWYDKIQTCYTPQDVIKLHQELEDINEDADIKSDVIMHLEQKMKEIETKIASNNIKKRNNKILQPDRIPNIPQTHQKDISIQQNEFFGKMEKLFTNFAQSLGQQHQNIDLEPQDDNKNNNQQQQHNNKQNNNNKNTNKTGKSLEQQILNKQNQQKNNFNNVNSNDSHDKLINKLITIQLLNAIKPNNQSNQCCQGSHQHSNGGQQITMHNDANRDSSKHFRSQQRNNSSRSNRSNSNFSLKKFQQKQKYNKNNKVKKFYKRSKSSKSRSKSNSRSYSNNKRRNNSNSKKQKKKFKSFSPKRNKNKSRSHSKKFKSQSPYRKNKSSKKKPILKNRNRSNSFKYKGKQQKFKKKSKKQVRFKKSFSKNRSYSRKSRQGSGRNYKYNKQKNTVYQTMSLYKHYTPEQKWCKFGKFCVHQDCKFTHETYNRRSLTLNIVHKQQFYLTNDIFRTAYEHLQSVKNTILVRFSIKSNTIKVEYDQSDHLTLISAFGVDKSYKDLSVTTGQQTHLVKLKVSYKDDVAFWQKKELITASQKLLIESKKGKVLQSNSIKHIIGPLREEFQSLLQQICEKQKEQRDYDNMMKTVNTIYYEKFTYFNKYDKTKGVAQTYFIQYFDTFFKKSLKIYINHQVFDSFQKSLDNYKIYTQCYYKVIKLKSQGLYPNYDILTLIKTMALDYNKLPDIKVATISDYDNLNDNQRADIKIILDKQWETKKDFYADIASKAQDDLKNVEQNFDFAFLKAKALSAQGQHNTATEVIPQTLALLDKFNIFPYKNQRNYYEILVNKVSQYLLQIDTGSFSQAECKNDIISLWETYIRCINQKINYKLTVQLFDNWLIKSKSLRTQNPQNQNLDQKGYIARQQLLKFINEQQQDNSQRLQTILPNNNSQIQNEESNNNSLNTSLSQNNQRQSQQQIFQISQPRQQVLMNQQTSSTTYDKLNLIQHRLYNIAQQFQFNQQELDRLFDNYNNAAKWGNISKDILTYLWQDLTDIDRFKYWQDYDRSYNILYQNNQLNN